MCIRKALADPVSHRRRSLGSALIGYRVLGVITGSQAATIRNPINADPGFVDATNGDFHLRDDFALIGRGLGVPPFLSFNGFDIDGKLGIRSSRLDLGAYENQQMIFGNGFE